MYSIAIYVAGLADLHALPELLQAPVVLSVTSGLTARWQTSVAATLKAPFDNERCNSHHLMGLNLLFVDNVTRGMSTWQSTQASHTSFSYSLLHYTTPNWLAAAAEAELFRML